MENWRTITDFPNYQVSDLGRIRRVGGYQAAFKANAIRKGMLNPVTGYVEVLLCVNYKKSMRRIHRLVAGAFLELNAKQQVNHKNGDKTDNRLENLECVTQSENMKHAYRELGISRPSAADIERDPKTDRIISMRKRLQLSTATGLIGRGPN